MPDPLPSDVVARLRSDSTAALAASLILAGSFPDIVSWALRAFSKSNEPKASVPAGGGGKSRHAPRPQHAVKSDRNLFLAVADTRRHTRNQLTRCVFLLLTPLADTRHNTPSSVAQRF
jgi:hypothetical protein